MLTLYKQKIITTAVYFCAILLLTTKSIAQISSSDDWLQISNAPQCASDMKEPTQSIFLAVSFRDTALILKELAPQIQQEPVNFIKNGNRAFKVKLNLLTEKIIRGLDNGKLPLIKTKNNSSVEQAWKNLNQSSASTDFNINEIKCYQVNDINSYYSHLFIRGINQSTLTELAKQYKDNESRINGCSSQNIEANTDFYPVFNYDLKIKDAKKWSLSGFDFWASFKIYLSWAWRNDLESNDSSTLVYQKVFKSIPIEEQVVILSNGCKSLSRPECNSDFLSSTELRTLFTLDRKKLDLTSSTLEMRDNIMDNNDGVDQKAQQQLALKSAENEWVRSFQKSYLGFTQAHKDKLYEANKLMSSLTAQVGLVKFNQDLLKSLQDKTQYENLYYMCSEARLLGQEKPLSIFKFDLEFIKQQGSKLNEMLKFGLTVEEMISLYENISPQLTQICGDFDQSIRHGNIIQENWTQYRNWYKNYLSRYKILKSYIDEEEQNQAKMPDLLPKSYVQGLCVNSVDCARNIIEGVVNINKVLLHSKTFFRTEFVQAPLFNERAEKVACGLYDPWEAGRLNHKKLLADVGSSLLFGWTNLPIYLDVNFKTKELISMSKLIEDGRVRFDTEFDKKQLQKSLAINFGSFFDVPCSIELSQTKKFDSSQQQAPLVFNGLAVSACKGKKRDQISSPQQQVDSFKKTPEADHAVCGQCAINFSQVAPIVAKNSFAPLRFLIRLAESLVRYNSAKNDDTINPRQFNINTKYLVETYDKYNMIPEQCVSMLTRGLRCQSNMCEALAVREFEIKTGLEVDTVSLTENTEASNSGSYDRAYFKVKGCQKEISVPMHCQNNGSSFYMMSISKRNLKSCSIDTRLGQKND